MPACAERVRDDDLERHRAELARHCRRLLGSGPDAEDAVQETLVRAWRGMGRLERRPRLRAWLFTIATNVCRDRLGRDAARGPTVALDPLAASLPDPDPGPAEAALRREAVRRAVATALCLTPRERAALMMCEVLRWPAGDAARHMGTSVASVTSALQRARSSIAARGAAPAEPPAGAADRMLMRGYVDALSRDDVAGLAAMARAEVARA